MIRSLRGATEEQAPFNVAWLARLVLKEGGTLRDICIASVALSVLTILPPLIVMQVVNRVVVHDSYSTLTMITVIIIVAALYETFLGYTRRQLMLIVGTRIDAKLNLHVFRRLLGLPLDYFERNQAGSITYNISQVYRIRDFMTGKLLTTFLDLITLLVLLPILFYISATLTWMVVGAAGLLSLVIVAFIGPLRRVFGQVVKAEMEKSSVLIETVHGMRTVQVPGPRAAAAGDVGPAQRGRREPPPAVRQSGQLAADARHPGRVVHEPRRDADRRLHRDLRSRAASASVPLIAFMMLSGRVAQPLVSIARLLEDMEEVRASVGQAAGVLNQKPESANAAAGLRPAFMGAISFDAVEFAYPGSKNKALNGVTFSIPAGTMLGLVGRSGSGKSTITRLLQGINREYDGYIKIDGTDLREINLAHMRRSFGVVLQENFLFRGTIRENILAGRSGLTLTDAVRAARLAGAEEFIERLPQGYETWIEEGSPNLSGGQRQRLAIARSLIHDPRLLILDEATSALDPESEALVNANLQRIAKGRTMVIVSHRLSSLTDCDQILVIDKGKIMDIGPHKELVERCSVYRTLWLQQNRHLEGQSVRPVPALAQGD